MPDSSSEQTSRRSANWLLYLALTLLSVGLLAVIAAFGIGLLTDYEPGAWLYLVAMAGTASGFLLALVFALWSGRRAR